MNLPKLSLQAKFLLGVALVCVVSGVFFVSTLYFHMKSLVFSEIRDKAHLVLKEATAIQDYVQTVLRPVMFKNLPPNRFILEAMSSSYISRNVMERLAKNSELYYRRVALNPRNPLYKPSALEKEIILYFKKRKANYFEGLRKVDNVDYYLVARPVVFKKTCLKCHGNPKDAPAELLKLYGNKRGFFHSPDEIGGAVIVGFPIKHTVSQVKEATLGYISIYSLMFLVFFALVSLYFRQLVILNFRKLTSVFRRHFSEPSDLNLLNKLQAKDELEELVLGMEELARHLYQARQRLKEYATQLEKMVQERTAALEQEVLERKKDVELLVNLVDLLTRHRENEVLITETLSLIATRFKLNWIGYVCSGLVGKSFIWPKNAPLPKALMLKNSKELEQHRFLMENNHLYFLVSSQERNWGYLVMPRTEYTWQNVHILQAISKQMGIALESIQSINELIYQYEILQSLFDGMSDPLFLIEENNELIMQNKAALNLNQELGFDFLGEFLAKEEHKQVIIDCLKSKRPGVVEWQQKDLWLFVRIYPLFVPPHGLQRFIIYVRDITSEKNMLEQIRRTEKLSAIGKLAAGIAHEINNPLGVILCYVDLLLESIDSGQPRKDLEVIKKHALQAQKILQDLLNFARPKTSFGICNLNELAKNIEDVFKIQAKKKNVDFELEVEPDLPLLAYDSSLLEQILTNLILNGFDAVENQEKARVQVKIVRLQDKLVLEVRDNGPGIKEEIKNLIFDPFFTTKEIGKGTGLGLAVVYGLVEELGGRIEVKNEQGAVFTVYLDLKLIKE